MTLIDQARRYFAAMPRAVAGRGGHTATFNAAVVLRRGFALPEATALDLIREWNATHCDPPWSDAELQHKIRSAAQADRPLGYLLGNSNGAVPRSTSLSDDEIQRKAEARRSWPEFRPLSDTTLVEIATLRHLPLEAVHIAHNAGLLRGAQYEGHRCFILTEGNFAQARRLDGGRLPVPSGEAKAKNLPGSQGSFIGKALLGMPRSTGLAGPIVLVEGCIGLLEGIAAALAVDADCADWTVVAATSASARMDAQWLERIRGRRVRIVPDNDAAGLEACAKWTVALRTVHAVVDAEMPPDGLKDLGPVAADPQRFTSYLNQLFTL